MSERKIKLQEIVNAAVEAGLRDLPTMLPAKVVKWDATKQKADCQILIKQVTTGEDESREVNPFGVVPAVPVQFLGAGGFRITCPISDGSSSAATTGSLFFSMRSLDKWLTGTGAEVDPEFDHAHALTDAVFIPGLMPFGSPWQSCPTDEMTIGADTGVQMHFQNGVIIAGDTAGAQFVALENLVKAQLDKIAASFAGISAPSGGGTCTVTPTYAAGSVAATQLKAK